MTTDPAPQAATPSVLTLPDEWEAQASSPRAPLTADLELEGAQVRRVLAAQLRERLADPKTAFGLLLGQRDALAAENEWLRAALTLIGQPLSPNGIDSVYLHDLSAQDPEMSDEEAELYHRIDLARKALEARDA